MEHPKSISYSCPVCAYGSFEFDYTVKDHFLTKEEFALYRCGNCGLMKTEPSPAPEELGKYYDSDEYLSHGDEKRGLFASLYRQAKKYNLGWKGRLLHRLNNQGEFLDYGCGTGDLMQHMQGLGHAVRGAEPSATARQHTSSLITDLIVQPEAELESDRTYDIVSLWHVLEHLYTPYDVLDRLVKKIRPSGHLVIAIPNPASHDAQHYAEDWEGLDVPRHLWHFTPAKMKKLGEGLGLKHIDTLPMWLDAFYVSMLSARYQGRGAVSGILQGLISNIKALGNKKGRCSSQVYIFQRD